MTYTGYEPQRVPRRMFPRTEKGQFSLVLASSAGTFAFPGSARGCPNGPGPAPSSLWRIRQRVFAEAG